jgi:hypothetical protein
VTGESYEVRVRIKVNDDVPDDTIFFIDPFQPNFSNENKGYTIPGRASEAKDGWIELRANFYANAVGGEVAFYVNCLFSSNAFREAAEFFPDAENYAIFYDMILGTNAESDVPAGAFVWVDAMTGDQIAIPALPDGQFEGRRLYYTRTVFYLRIGGVMHVIEEPIKWDDVNIQIIFDEKTKMYRFEFSDKDVLLEFDNKAGRQLLRPLWKTKGAQAEAQLIFGEYDTIEEELTIHYIGDINFEEAEDIETVFRANIERQTFGEKIRTYFDQEVNVFATETLGGLPREPISLKQLFLHPRLLSYVADAKYNENVDENQEPDEHDLGGGEKSFIVIPPYKSKANNITNYQDPQPPDGTNIYAGLELPAGVTKRKFFFEMGMSFRYTKNGSPQQLIAGFGILKVSNIAGGPTSPGGTPFGGPNGVVVTDTQIAYISRSGILAGTYEVNGACAGYIELEADEALFVRSSIWVTVDGDPPVEITDFEFTNINGFYLRIREESVFAPSVVSVPLIHDALNRQIEVITDKVNPLKSDLLGRIDLGYTADGGASKHFTMNGLMLRKFDGKPFNMSIKNMYNTIDALYCAGMSIERNDEGDEWVRLEELPYFFRNILLFDFKVISKFKRRVATKFTYNALRFYFKKYPQDNQQDSIEDFHTSMEYVTPITKVKNDLSVQIDSILSGYYIEYTRREGLTSNPTNSYETDNDTFLISARESGGEFIEKDVIVNEDNKTITVIGIIPAVPGDIGIGKQLITLANGTGGVSNGTWTIVSVEIPFSYDRIIITVSEAIPGDATGTADITLSSTLGPVDRYEAKRDEDFENVTGVTFPTSAYNLEHHLKRVSLRHAKYFQAGWSMFEDVASLKQKFVNGKNNTSARTKFKSTVDYRPGDSQRLDRQDDASELVTRFDKSLFSGFEDEFEAPLTWTSFNYIRMAFEGRNPDGKDYGYVQYPDIDNVKTRGWIYKMKFKPTRQMITLNVIVKNDA